ncbi:hypothetical protein M3Y94_00034000 [Aphelenchoides besseyi]|nr:hypothetical protein M3Y94_00034000 [Aphelenchoides besseyi]KAI6218590.1 hypothetical protein M3Y95_01158900 [Aphelenchoides besseyi]
MYLRLVFLVGAIVLIEVRSNVNTQELYPSFGDADTNPSIPWGYLPNSITEATRRAVLGMLMRVGGCVNETQSKDSDAQSSPDYGAIILECAKQIGCTDEGLLVRITSMITSNTSHIDEKIDWRRLDEAFADLNLNNNSKLSISQPITDSERTNLCLFLQDWDVTYCKTRAKFTKKFEQTCVDLFFFNSYTALHMAANRNNVNTCDYKAMRFATFINPKFSERGFNVFQDPLFLSDVCVSPPK